MVFLEISPRNDNKSNSYNSTKDTLHNTQAQLRDPHINTSESGKTREEGRGGNAETWATGQSPELTVVSGEGRIQAAGAFSVTHNPA